MRFSALIPALLCTGALALSFLCLFAGSSRGFMQDYAVLTLNTSRIGESVLNASHHSSNPFVSILNNLTNTIENDVDSGIKSIAKDLGLHDFYAVHILDYCEGYYVPGPVPNTTLSRSSIRKNVTMCSNKTAMYNFDPQTILQQELNKSGHSNIDLTSLHWPSQINTGLHALRIAERATFVLYCVATGLIGIALVLSLLCIFFEGRLSAFLNVLVDWLAFLAIGVASGIVTAVMVKSTDVVNHYGNEIGISASKGSKFLALTWAGTGVMLVATFVWCFECIVGHRKHRSRATRAYDGEPKYAQADVSYHAK